MINNSPTTIIQNEDAKAAVEDIVKVLEAYNIPPNQQLQAEIKEVDYQENFKKLNYFKRFKDTPREPDLKEAITDMLHIFSGEAVTIKSLYESNKSDPSKAVTMIWTNSQLVSRLINFALIVDAGKQFKFDNKDMDFFKDRTVIL